MLFVDSADKAARFIWLCDAFNIPLLYLADVPGFMIGTKVERAGIIRAGRQDDLRRLRGDACPSISRHRPQGLRRGPLRHVRPRLRARTCTLALPQAMIAVMGPEAAVNAVYFNKIQEKPEAERAAYVQKLRDEYRADVDILKLASELVVDEIVPGDELAATQLERRLRGLLPAVPAPRR